VMFRLGLAEGSMRAVDIRPTLMAIAGVSSWTANAAHEADTPPDPHVAREIVGLVINGIRAR